MNLKEVKSAYPESIPGKVFIDNTLTLLRRCQEYGRLKKDLVAQTTKLDDVQASICTLLETAESGATPDGRTHVTWKNNKPSEKTDWEAIAKSLGASDALIKRHTTTKLGNRVFNVK